MSSHKDRQQGLQREVLHTPQSVKDQREGANCDTADSSGTNPGAPTVFSLVLTLASEHETREKPGPLSVLKHLPAPVWTLELRAPFMLVLPLEEVYSSLQALRYKPS